MKLLSPLTGLLWQVFPLTLIFSVIGLSLSTSLKLFQILHISVAIFWTLCCQISQISIILLSWLYGLLRNLWSLNIVFYIYQLIFSKVTHSYYISDYTKANLPDLSSYLLNVEVSWCFLCQDIWYCLDQPQESINQSFHLSSPQ